MQFILKVKKVNLKIKRIKGDWSLLILKLGSNNQKLIPQKKKEID